MNTIRKGSASSEENDQESFYAELEFKVEYNVITLIFDPEALGTFDVIISVNGVSGETILTYTVTDVNE